MINEPRGVQAHRTAAAVLSLGQPPLKMARLGMHPNAHSQLLLPSPCLPGPVPLARTRAQFRRERNKATAGAAPSAPLPPGQHRHTLNSNESILSMICFNYCLQIELLASQRDCTRPFAHSPPVRISLITNCTLQTFQSRCSHLLSNSLASSEESGAIREC